MELFYRLFIYVETKMIKVKPVPNPYGLFYFIMRDYRQISHYLLIEKYFPNYFVVSINCVHL